MSSNKVKNEGRNSLISVMVITSLICLLPIAFGVICYDKMPSKIGIHFNNAGEADNYINKALAIFGLPIGLALLNLYNQFRLETDPKAKNYSVVLKQIFRWLIPVISVVAMSYTIIVAMGANLKAAYIGNMIAGLLLIIVGNYLLKCHSNYTMGIKLPWTLDDEDNWNRTHRMAGFLWVVGGIVCLLNIFVKLTYIVIGVIAALVIVPILYSYLLYRKNN